MKDIDFDELDKAVSSILGGDDKPPISNNQPAPGSQPISSSSIPVTTPVTGIAPVSTFTTPKVDPPTDDSAASGSPITRRSGRFMDVVRPSSDMGGPTNSGAPRASLPMTGRTLQPVSEEVIPEVIEPVDESNDPFAPLGTEMPITKAPDPATLISTEDTDDTVWPDPLDVHGFTDTPPTDVPVTQPKTDTLPASLESEPIAPISETIPPIDNSQPPTSPFISDAKVEKRPLGAFSDQPAVVVAPESPQPLLEATSGEETNDQLAPEVPPTTTSEPLPRELESDVVALEGNDHTVEADAPGSDSELEQEVTSDEPATPPVSGAALSIPQQYKTAERNKKDSDEHPIFDTTEYHAALPVKTKKKSSLGIWIGVLVLLVVIAAATAGVWWFYLK